MDKRVFLVSAALGASLGFGTGALSELQTVNARESINQVMVEKQLGAAACANLASQAENQLCDAAEAKAGYDADTCSVESGSIGFILFNKQTGGVWEDCTFRMQFAFAETAVKGTPQ